MKLFRGRRCNEILPSPTLAIALFPRPKQKCSAIKHSARWQGIVKTLPGNIAKLGKIREWH